MFEQFNFAKDFHNVTTVHPVGLMALAMAIFAIMTVPRRFVLVPLIITACIIAPSQRIVIGGMDFTFLRVVTAVGWLRVMVRDEHRRFSLTIMDKVVIAWVTFSAAAYLLLWPNIGSIAFQFGTAFDCIATYFLVRMLVRDTSDIIGLARGAAILAVPVAVAMSFEFSSGYNMFSVFGGVPEQTLERYGRFRAQAAFAHPIIAGTFWAALIPIMLAGVRRTAGSIALTSAGVAASLVIVWCSSQSTPIMLVGVVIISACLFPIRWAMPWLRVGTLATIAMLHLVMFAPVWHLFARMNIFAGSTGWWRYLIIDRFVNQWQEWILIGTTRSPAWLVGNAFTDVTNQYVAEGINGGIVKLALFLAILVLSFMSVGRAIRSRQDLPLAEVRSSGDASRRWMAWCVGTMIAVHAAAYFATGYFGQLVMLHFLSFGLAASMPVVIGRPMARRRLVDAESVPPEPCRAGAAPAAVPVAPVPGFIRGVGASRPSLFRPV